MYEPVMQLLLFGRVNIFESLKRHAQQSSQIEMADAWLTLAAFGGFAVLLFVLAKLFSHNEKPRATNSPLRLFWNLCCLHDLKFSQRWLLWRIARQHGLKAPALLFVEPELLDVDVLGGKFVGQTTAVATLRKQLFQGLSEDAP